MIVSFFFSYWRKILVAVVIVGAVLFIYRHIYEKGKKACEEKIQRVVVEETTRRIDEANREEEKSRETISKIKRDRSTNPVNDARDSCILSNDPLKKDCLNSK